MTQTTKEEGDTFRRKNYMIVEFVQTTTTIIGKTDNLMEAKVAMRNFIDTEVNVMLHKKPIVGLYKRIE